MKTTLNAVLVSVISWAVAGTQAMAQPAVDIPLAPDVAAREPRECVVELPPQQVGKSAWMTNLWPAGVVPYVFDANTDASMQAAMRASMNVIEGAASIHFVERTGQANYITVRNSTGNNSMVGMIGGVQTVNIYNWNYTYIMCHELFHALGIQHEQSRPDRDQYVTINYPNISVDQGQCGGSCAYNFDIVASAAPHGAYDFDSIMHYGAMSFSDNGQPTISVLPPNQAWQSQIGQRTHLSTGDIAGLQSRYGSLVSTPWNLRASTGPTARDGLALAYDSARHFTVLFGGFTAATTRVADTWEWNGSAWAQRAVTGPTARGLHAMAYDSTRSKVVLFGGSTAAGAYNSETWEWNGTSWTQRSVTGPSGRNLHAMAFDSTRNVTVLFGGMTSTSARSGETWEWNGTAWTLRSSSGPAARSGSALTFDSARRVTVLFGGQTSAGVQGDTWEWNGTVWTLRSATGPSARTQAAMAYDPTRALTSLFGGTGTIQTNENWDWSGSAWMQRTSGGPTARGGHAMADDTTRGVTVLFGGLAGTARSGETWELGTPCAAPTIALHPGPTSSCVQGSATFTMTGWGNGMLSYQWKKGTTPLADLTGRRAGCTTPTLTLTGITTADAGTYTCAVTDLCGTTATNGALLTVNTTPTPVSAAANPPSICAGGSSTLTATAPGGQLIVWYNASTNTVASNPVHPTATTGYYAVANPFSCPSAHSQLVTVTVNPAPAAPTSIDVTPAGAGSYCASDAPASITLTAVGGAGGAVAWRLADGTPADGCGTTDVTGTTATLVVSPAPTVTTTYYARYTGGCGESACASVTIAITSCPADIGGTGGAAGGDCTLDNNDFIVFINEFFNGETSADRGQAGGVPGSDGVLDNNDFIVFIDQFFSGCP